MLERTQRWWRRPWRTVGLCGWLTLFEGVRNFPLNMLFSLATHDQFASSPASKHFEAL